MRTGVSYMGHQDPRHIRTDLKAMTRLGLDDVLLAAQEDDFVHFTGTIRFTPGMARDHGLRPIAIFWGALNLFGGGKSSKFLLEHPEGFQVARDGSHRPHGCYVNPVCVARIEQMIDTIAEAGFEGYFIDEPRRLRDCYCPSCRQRFGQWYGADLAACPDAQRDAFRQRCVVEYVRTISDYCKANHPRLETITCLVPGDRALWPATAEIASLDNLGTDMYWANNDTDVAEMAPILDDLAAVCAKRGKIHHEWLQCCVVQKGREHRIVEQGRMLIRHRPDALYVWAWRGQIGTIEACEDPLLAWRRACDVLRLAKSGG